MFENAKVTIDLKEFNYLMECEKELKKCKAELEKFKDELTHDSKNNKNLSDAIKGSLETLTKS